MFEVGDTVWVGMLAWGQVRFFSPWRYTVDPAARGLPVAGGAWTEPDGKRYPSGREFVERYLNPMAAKRPCSRRPSSTRPAPPARRFR